jgi:DNA invertase Pin-like site-specific DNA recombinase
VRSDAGVHNCSQTAAAACGILETVKALTDLGVTLVSATDGIDSSTAAARMTIGVLGSLAEYERELTKERTMSEKSYDAAMLVLMSR